MKELIVAGKTSEKMTSREIAELTGKQHKNVMRDIQALIEQDAIDGLSFELVDYSDAKGEKRPMYSLDFKATMTLVTGYDAKRRSIVIDRWIDLETGAVAPAFSLPTTYKEALLELVSKVEENEQLQLTITTQAPTIAAFDRIAMADGLLNITNTAKTLQVHPNQLLFSYLSQNGWIYRRSGGWVAYQNRIQQGLLSHKVTTVITSDGREKITEQVLVTPKGLAKLATVFPAMA